MGNRQRAGMAIRNKEYTPQAVIPIPLPSCFQTISTLYPNHAKPNPNTTPTTPPDRPPTTLSDAKTHPGPYPTMPKHQGTTPN